MKGSLVAATVAFRRDRFRQTSRLTPYSDVTASPMPDPVSIDVALRPLLVDAKQAARLLGIGRTTLYELIHAGAISPLHIGRCVRFAVTDLEAFVANGCVAGAQPSPGAEAGSSRLAAPAHATARREVRHFNSSIRPTDPAESVTSSR